DVVDVARIMRLDRRIGKDAFLSAGLGFAGGTLGRDVRALQALGRRTGRATALMDAVIAVNEARAGLVEERLRRLYGSLRGLRAAMGRPVMIDTRNFFDPGEMKRLGFTYFGIGRSGGALRGRKEHYGA